MSAATIGSIQLQASKSDEEQPSIATTLPAFSPDTVADACVIGCGPAGLALSSELAKQGLSVCLIGELWSPADPSSTSALHYATVPVKLSSCLTLLMQVMMYLLSTIMVCG